MNLALSLDRVVLNPAFEREAVEAGLTKEPELQAAEAVAAAARAIAPVLTGAYRDSIHPEQDDESTRVVASSDHAVFVEFGTSDTPTFAPLRRGAEAAGLKATT